MLLASFLGFLLLFLAIGFSSALVRRARSDDYLVAGRTISPALAGLSAVATNNSGYMFIGVIGFTYSVGLQAIWLMVGWIVGDLFASLLIHRRVREVGAQRQALTFPELVATWGGGNYVLLMKLAAMISVLFLGSYAAAQFNAGSKAMHVLLGWDYATGAIVGAVMVFFYCFSGGIRASIWTDVAQSLVMIVAMGLLLHVALEQVGGARAAWTALHEVSPAHMNWFPGGAMVPGAAGAILFVVGWLFAGFAVAGQPHIMIRFMALDSPTHLWRTRLYYYVWFTAFYALANGVGLVSRLLIPEHGFDAELALPVLARELLHPALAGLVLAGLFAATISTADSLILSCSAALSRDLPPARWRSWRLTRYATLVVSVLALLIALHGEQSVFHLVIMSWSVLGAAFAPLLLVYALGGRPSQRMAIAMMGAGVATVLLWREAGLHIAVYEAMPGMLAGWLVYGGGEVVKRVRGVADAGTA